MTVKTEYGTYKDCVLALGDYLADNALSISIWNATDGAIATITKCLDVHDIAENESFVDTNNCPWAEDFIKEYHLGEFAGIYGMNGYCTYPLYRFNADELKKYEDIKGGRFT